ncbi:sigma-70 family RNA polymerase sigma factor [Nonomuraea glycinis]|uniref:sigma-70 family RNA polymerase sigma factor n=1 Tax=Nonomuraea glycinis TaxID=2047744 RepID=UPI00166DA40F|nr:sigma-70 family RNA polymerase sigma factor [Nonomuraea glycinis]MCA2175432.1 sigma-70 family RNA polymerase sigma factor [Nonomuraea glycinis]WSG63693.1 sigma-70 family RNA polymerase sigma factor [Nonomuraea glycinis]
MARPTGSRGSEQHVADRDLLGTYLSEIGRVPLLTAEQEVELAKRIEAGLFAEQLLDSGGSEPRMGDAADEELERLAISGQRAKDEFIQANLRLVVAVARKYSGRGMPLIDLVQEGNLGLVRAVEKFDYKRGYKFSTYATWWIRQSVGRAIHEQARPVRLPTHAGEQMTRLMRVRRDMLAELDVEPTDEELAALLELPIERVKELRRWASDPVSLQLGVGDEDETELGDMIADDTWADPEQQAIDILERERLDQWLTDLEGDTRDMLRWRYGLVDGREHTLTEVGERYGIGRDRARRIERDALARLRRMADAAA